MISCVSPSSEHIEETLLTLNYAKKTMNIINEPKITFNHDGEIVLQETEEYKIIKKQNDILIKENRQLRKDIQKKITLLENREDTYNESPTESEKPETRTREETDDDSKNQLIKDYEKQLIDLNKGFNKQKNRNLLLAKKMEV
jgi:hypothetical protein